MAKDYVQKYLWRDVGEPFATAWQITLTADEAVVFLAMVCILITYTQTRTWSLARKSLIRIVRPIQLPDNDNPTSLSRLSQYEAISRLLSNNILPWLRRGRSARPQTNAITITWPVFGIAAIANAILFVVMGVLIPWLLTGGLETPVVQSTLSDRCRLTEAWNSTSTERHYYATRKSAGDFNIYAAVEKYRQCWKDFPLAPTPCPRVDGPLMDRPPVRIIYQPESCRALSDETCLNGLSKFQVYHDNLTLRDYGLNVQSALRHTRRLTCTPLALQVLFLEDEKDNSHPGFPESKNQTQLESLQILDSHISTLHSRNITLNLTRNSPQLCTNCQVLLDYQDEDLEQFFVFFEKVVVNSTSGHGHGQVFIIVNTFDQSWGVPQLYQFIRSFATSYGILGCQEHHKICLDRISSDKCTRFTNSTNALKEMAEAFEEDDVLTKQDMCAFSDILYQTSTAKLHSEMGNAPAMHPWSDMSSAVNKSSLPSQVFKSSQVKSSQVLFLET